jgi:acid phosphatase (class A)
MNTLLWLFLISTSSFAGWESMDQKQFTLPPPPQLHSAEEQADVQTMLQMQSQRTQKDCTLSQHQLSASFTVFFEPASGMLSKEELRRVSPFFFRISKFMDPIVQRYKSSYRRARPYDSYKQIKPCIQLPGGSKSYPSSHAAMGFVEACVLAEIFPDRADKIMKYGNYVGNLRTIAGVHYPRDVQAGKDLGQQVCEALLKNPEFQHDMAQLP